MPVSEIQRTEIDSQYTYDGLGDVVNLVDGYGNLVQTYYYDAFGKSTNVKHDVVNKKQFTGKEVDEDSGLYYFLARYYDPETGRFLSEDSVPAGNLYVYCSQDPINKVDPDGREESPEEQKARLKSYPNAAASQIAWLEQGAPSSGGGGGQKSTELEKAPKGLVNPNSSTLALGPNYPKQGGENYLKYAGTSRAAFSISDAEYSAAKAKNGDFKLIKPNIEVLNLAGKRCMQIEFSESFTGEGSQKGTTFSAEVGYMQIRWGYQFVVDKVGNRIGMEPGPTTLGRPE